MLTELGQVRQVVTMVSSNIHHKVMGSRDRTDRREEAITGQTKEATTIVVRELDFYPILTALQGSIY